MREEFCVGARLREVRIAYGLSQRALADRASVPHGQISLVETGKNSPSVASLRKILGGLPMTMSDFFEPDRVKTDTVFFEASDYVDLTSRIPGASGGKGGSISLKQVGDATEHNLQILHEVYEPGADTGATMLDHASHEGGVVISGMIEVTVGSQIKVLKAGDGYLFDSRKPHRFFNPGPEVAVVISACTPPYL